METVDKRGQNVILRFLCQLFVTGFTHFSAGDMNGNEILPSLPDFWLTGRRFRAKIVRQIAGIAQSVEQLIRNYQTELPKTKYATVAQPVEQLIRNYQTGLWKIEYATVAQPVEQLIRNQQVVCSSHISSSKKR